MKKVGGKYHRNVHDTGGAYLGVVDVYCVLDAFGVTNPGVQHAVKKLLCSGIRDKGPVEQDLIEAIESIERALIIHKKESVLPTQPEVKHVE